jgi:type IX secretion system PorP/SprF family membrane protein
MREDQFIFSYNCTVTSLFGRVRLLAFTSLLLTASIVLPGSAKAQDLLFTQMYSNPTYINPSMAGVYDALYRISLQHRSQWNSVLDQPYKTYGLSGDARLDLGRDRNRLDAFSIGLVFLSDKVDQYDFSMTQISLVGAFHKNLGGENQNFLSAGFSLGMRQQNINYENLRFQDMFDGTIDFSRPTSEIFPDNNFSYPDLSLGMNYSFAQRNGIRINAGASILHILKPDLSFYQNEDNPAYTGEDEYLMNRNFIGHVSVEAEVLPRFWLSPRVVTSFQGPHHTFFFGTGSRMLLSDSRASFLHLGVFGRVTNRLDEYKFRDIALLIGFEIEGIRLGLSYDLSLDDLQHYSQRQGIFEISITMMGEYFNENDLCPQF